MTTNWEYEKQKIRLLGASLKFLHYETICNSNLLEHKMLQLHHSSKIQYTVPNLRIRAGTQGGLSNMYSSTHAIEIDRTFYRRDIATTPTLQPSPEYPQIILQSSLSSQIHHSSPSPQVHPSRFHILSRLGFGTRCRHFPRGWKVKRG